MKIVVDKETMLELKTIEEIACSYDLLVQVYLDYSDPFECEYAKRVYLDTYYQNTDLAILYTMDYGDILITYDYYLAMAALLRYISVITPTGQILTKENIHKTKKVRSLGKKIVHKKKSPSKKRTYSKKLYKTLIPLIEKNQKLLDNIPY